MYMYQQVSTVQVAYGRLSSADLMLKGPEGTLRYRPLHAHLVGRRCRMATILGSIFRLGPHTGTCAQDCTLTIATVTNRLCAYRGTHITAVLFAASLVKSGLQSTCRSPPYIADIPSAVLLLADFHVCIITSMHAFRFHCLRSQCCYCHDNVQSFADHSCNVCVYAHLCDASPEQCASQIVTDSCFRKRSASCNVALRNDGNVVPVLVTQLLANKRRYHKSVLFGMLPRSFVLFCFAG